MPADFFIDAPRRMVFSKATGVLDLPTALDHMDRLERHPDFLPLFDQLFDFRQVTAITLSHQEVKELAMRKIFGERSRRAFVVAGDWQFGIGRVFGTYREIEGEPGIVIFREMEKAAAWLGLAAEPAAGLFTQLTPTAPEAAPALGGILKEPRTRRPLSG